MKTELAVPDRLLIGEAYLKFQLAPSVPAVLAASAVEEATVLSTTQVTPMPNMPACLLGLVNRRSRVIWIANLVQLLGLAVPDKPRQQHSTVIVKSGLDSSAGSSNLSLGLVVDEINGIIHLPTEALQPVPTQVSPILVPYLRGCAVQNEQILLVLDAEAVLRSSIFQGS
ncbi:chemotaxis protein CheW [cf. Phormidesmis sp. LEGE 11477]|uniref:chemotaxis protein CheW n=1 Tax=cf. Phormidesmis sp. LEGE 11477 TaxID=1828680 RepID=UPI001882780C|nr:chemotaxis protein CheW [cf. Phormidesmis sp. LEGE 11477]